MQQSGQRRLREINAGSTGIPDGVQRTGVFQTGRIPKGCIQMYGLDQTAHDLGVSGLGQAAGEPDEGRFEWFPELGNYGSKQPLP